MAMNVKHSEGSEIHGSRREQNGSKVVQRVLTFGVLSLAAAGAACFLVPVWSRGRLQRAHVSALLRFDASICAQYGTYAYTPPPSMLGSVDGDSFRIILGRGQKADGFSVVDEPSGYLSWIAPVFDDHCFAQVTEISVRDARFSDSDVDLLLAFPTVRAIDLSDTSITDSGVIKLATMEQLVLLDVSGTRLSDQSLLKLAHCGQLKEVDVRDTDVGEQAVKSLQAALPGCWVRWE